MSKTTVNPKTPKVAQEMKIVQKVIAEDTYLVLSDSALSMEDEFQSLYFSSDSSSNIVLQPPFDPKVLARLPNQNNILSQCIEAMEVNIDGTGHEFMAVDNETKMDETEYRVALDFFSEPYPGRSFTQVRRKLRRDMEAIGFSFLEVLRTVDGALAAVRNLETPMMRLVRLDAAVPVAKTVTRNGAEIVFTMMERERRYVQRVGTDMVYYSEFGASRHLNKKTGEWAAAGETLDASIRATEIIPFGVNPDVGTSYSVPRWINQLPSVLGSRKAEEANLEFFDAGGMPPAIIFVQGGTLAGSTSDQLRGYLSGQAKNRSRAVVVEAQSTSGTLDSSGGVQIKVERFGSESTKDAMYQNYDKAAEDHVRTGFRLPPLFLGKAADYNYATAVVAYMVAEAQVFGPERSEFDDIVNKTLIKELGLKTVKFKSSPITLKNIDNQLKSIAMLRGLVKEEDYVNEIAKIGGVNLPFDQATADQTRESERLRAEQAKANTMAAPAEPSTGEGALKTEVLNLAQRYAQSRGLLAVKSEFSDTDLGDIDRAVGKLAGDDLEAFNRLISTWAFKSDDALLVHAIGCTH